jgi:hypothetical protein
MAPTWATTCAETVPEQSSRTVRLCGTTRETWEEEQTVFTYDCKKFVPRFFLRFCTRLILGLKPKNQTTQHDDLSRSHHVTTALWEREGVITIQLLVIRD